MGIMETSLALLDEMKIRRTLHNNEWWFAVEEACGMLMDSPDGGACWRKLKRRLGKEGCDVGALCQGLALPVADGTERQTDCATLEGVFRIVQSVATPKAEVVKRWLAEIGRGGGKTQGYRTDLDSIFALLGDEVAAIVNRQAAE